MPPHILHLLSHQGPSAASLGLKKSSKFSKLTDDVSLDAVALQGSSDVASAKKDAEEKPRSKRARYMLFKFDLCLVICWSFFLVLE